MESGYLPTEDIANYCMPADPEATENGETCDDRDPEAIRLFNFPNGESFTLVEGGSSIIEIARTARCTSCSRPRMATAAYIFEATYEGGHDWNEWLALPGMHSYKKDCADIFAGIEIPTEWIYYIMDNGTMMGRHLRLLV